MGEAQEVVQFALLVLGHFWFRFQLVALYFSCDGSILFWGGGGVGVGVKVLRVSSEGDDRMGEKIKNQKNP